MERLQEKYNKEIIPALTTKFGFKNVMEVPKIVKIVLNVGLGKIKEDKKKIDQTFEDFKKLLVKPQSKLRLESQFPVLRLEKIR
jgi:large subunit ribosomal protein L5